MTTPRMPTDDYARAKGWHIWRQVNRAGQVIFDKALCPDHAGNAKRQTGPVHMDGEQTLW